ncbi:MAG: hypothetical protein Q8Q95_02900 [bacterium]|nr:hypothetical protein [bacterium]
MITIEFGRKFIVRLCISYLILAMGIVASMFCLAVEISEKIIMNGLFIYSICSMLLYCVSENKILQNLEEKGW